MRKTVSMLLVAGVMALVLNVSAEVSIQEGTIDLPSYAISAPEKSPVFDCKWSYQRARRSIYPYALNDNLYAEKSEMREMSTSTVLRMRRKMSMRRKRSTLRRQWDSTAVWQIAISTMRWMRRSFCRAQQRNIRQPTL